MLKETNTPTRPRIEPGSPDPESDALTINYLFIYFLFILFFLGGGLGRVGGGGGVREDVNEALKFL